MWYSFITFFYTKRSSQIFEAAAGVVDVEWAWGERWDLAEESHQVSWVNISIRLGRALELKGAWLILCLSHRNLWRADGYMNYAYYIDGTSFGSTLESLLMYLCMNFCRSVSINSLMLCSKTDILWTEGDLFSAVFSYVFWTWHVCKHVWGITKISENAVMNMLKVNNP